MRGRVTDKQRQKEQVIYAVSRMFAYVRTCARACVLHVHERERETHTHTQTERERDMECVCM